MEVNDPLSALHMLLLEAGYGSGDGLSGSEISRAVSGVTTPGASRLQASQLQERSTTTQRLHTASLDDVPGYAHALERCVYKVTMAVHITATMDKAKSIARSVSTSASFCLCSSINCHHVSFVAATSSMLVTKDEAIV